MFSPEATVVDQPAEDPEFGSLAKEAKGLNEVPRNLAAPQNEDGSEDEYPEGGRGWWVVLGCAIITAVTLGWGLAWGVFQDYYKRNVFPETSDSVLSLLGSLAGTIMTPVSLVSGKMGDRYGYKPFIAAGCVFTFLGMLFAAFSHSLWQFFLTQGVLQGIGIGLVLPIAMSYPSQWFKKRRGLATGIVIAGSSFGGGAATLVAQELLSRIGLRYTLLTYAFLHMVLMTMSVFMLKSRAHPGAAAKRHAPIQWIDTRLLSDPIFWSIAMAIFFTVFGYLTPYYYIQQYTVSKLPSLSDTAYSVPGAVMNFSAAAGRTLIGMFADRIGVCNAFIIAATMAGLVQLVIWNFADSYALIIVFSALFGFFGGAFLSLTSVLAAKLFGVHQLATLSGLLVLFNTPGNAAGAPIAGGIFSASGNNWRAPIIFSGFAQIVGGLCILYARFKREPRLFARY